MFRRKSWPSAPNHLAKIAFLFALGIALSACGDKITGTGELGRVNYSLYTVYRSETNSIQNSLLLVGHSQEITTDLTGKGERDVEDPSELTHVVVPAAGVTWVVDKDSGSIPDADMTVTWPGSYMLETRLGTEIFDRIQLRFAKPERLDVIAWVKQTQDDDFEKVTTPGTIWVSQGSQVSVIPVPLDSNGTRIMGDFKVEITANPPEAMVAVENILAVYEQNLISSSEPVSLVFVEPGEIEVTIRDVVNEVEGFLTFQVEALQAGK